MESNVSLEDRYFLHFALRRVHSLLGLYLVGFIAFHFFSNSFAWNGAAAYNHKVELIREILGPWLIPVELGLLAVPFLIHIVYGFVIISDGSVNARRNSYLRNWSYILQRVTAVLVLVFLAYHVYSLRIASFEGKEQVRFFEYLASDYFRSPLILTFYVVGIAAAVFHLANGLCTFCMTWGLTIGPASQRGFALLATLVGLGYFGAAMMSLAGFLLIEEGAEVVAKAIL